MCEARDEAVRLALNCRDGHWISSRWREVGRHWDDLLSRCNIDTPDGALNVLFNRWLPYQIIASRLWARAGYYQTAGGYGYRDQLQDAIGLLAIAPEFCREQILLAASMQFEAGDVLHWWHPDPTRGVRTRCSDDLLWLPFAVAEYIAATSDFGLLNEQVRYLAGAELEDDQSERYAEYTPGPKSGPLFEHCYRAIDAGLTVGSHGLPLIGSGDWNDGLNRVGSKGRGESVWLAWFLAVTCRRFAPLCDAMDDPARARHYERTADTLIANAEASAWVGDHYLRGFYDDGTPLGGPESDECTIDLNAQTWAVIAGADPERIRIAMETAERDLADAPHELIKLLTPAFQNTHDDPGYIKAYPPGVRENGGQYTHAAVWAVWAALELGECTTAGRWLEWLNPILHADSAEKIGRYVVEPYVVAADVYGEVPLAGRGGWTWYTGAAGWMYQTIFKKLLGLEVQNEMLTIEPRIPDDWPQFELTWRYQNANYRIKFERAGSQVDGPTQIFLDGVSFEHGIPLSGDGDHFILVSRVPGPTVREA